MSGNLAKIRAEIDAIDSQLATLLVKRLDCSRRVGAVKREQGIAVLDQKREEAVLARVAALAGDGNASAMRRVFTEIMNASKDVQA